MQIPRFVGEFGYLLKKKKEKRDGNPVVFDNMLLLPPVSKNEELVGRPEIFLLCSNLVVGTLSRGI